MALNSRVTFDQRAATDDGYGNLDGDWVEQFTRAADIIPQQGGESVIAARLTGVQPVLIRVRMDTQTREIKSGWRARNARTGTIFSILTAIDPDQAGRQRGLYVELMCKAGIDG